MSSLNLAIGQKVQLNDGRHAVIRFKGTTAFAPGDWVGVELADGSGKNDGSVQGERYFDCEDKHGMFLRSTGVTKILESTKTTSRPSAANGSSTAKSRTSTVGVVGRAKDTTLNGRTRESSVSSPTPARSVGGRISSLKVSRDYTLGSATPTDQIKDKPSPFTIISRSSHLHTTFDIRPENRHTNIVGPFEGRGSFERKCRNRKRGPVGASTEDRDLRSDGRSPILSPGSDIRSQPEEVEVDSKEDEKDHNEAEPVDGGDIDATPRPVRTVPAASTNATSRTPSTQSLSPTMSSASVRPPTARGAAAANREIEDLQTKLRVLEKRRLEDREKLRALERIQQERDRFESIIQKLQQKYQPQQQELADLKKQIKESEERFAGIENIQAEHDAELENATLDREMAEEQYEAVKTELAALREKYEELELEVDVLREENQELGQEMSPEERTSQGWLQLERSNERYREALIRLRDITQEQEAELKQQVASLEKELEQFSGINKEAEDLKVKLLESEAAIADLKQQLDLAQGGEEMLEELSERNMTLQERIEDLSATIDDLENLRELNDELEVNHIEAEKQMQEEIDFKDSIINEQLRRSQEQRKAIDDYEVTVARFREAFRNLQADLEDMRASKQITDTEAEDLNSKSKALIDLNMKLQSSAAKTQIKTLDLELQRLEAEEAAQHLAIVRLFLPESYQTDRDSVLALLRFKRVAFKADLLHNMVKERISEQLGDDLFSGCGALDRLAWVRGMSTRFINAIHACPADDFAKFEGALYELEPVERGLNNYIDMLKHEDLQLKRVDEELERSMAVMAHLASTLLPDTPLAVAGDILMQTVLLQSHLDSAASALTLTKSLVDTHVGPARYTNGVSHDNSDEDDSDEDVQPSFQPFFDRIDALISQSRSAKVLASKAHRELEDLHSRNLTLESVNLPTFTAAALSASTIALFTRTAGLGLVALTTDPTGHLTPRDVASTITRIATSSFSLPQPETSPLSTLHARLNSLTEQLTALHNLSISLPSTLEFETPEPPWVQRSHLLRSTAAASSTAQTEIVRLNEILAERNLLVRSKEKELDEQSVRIEMLEARMRDAGKRAGRIEELETRIGEVERERRKWKTEVERWEKEVERLRTERDEAVKMAEEGKGKRVLDDEEVMGRKARLELERRRVQVEGLRGVVRYLSRGGGGEEWLFKPLVREREGKGRRLEVLEREARDVCLSLVELAGAEMVDLRGRRGAGWRPAKETSAYAMGTRKENYAAWMEWRDSVVQRAAVLTKEKQMTKV
ncbi:Dynactin, isoform [Sphaceloma murrayae]|uniref:Dynactin, isoform n=1 Tax=Sphaceloma murrayae TaxID=2082308 RepID=A0A2K1QP39_9PEZI|nr:Dynactin, isoform [Sphaceloma murrayae]